MTQYYVTFIVNVTCFLINETLTFYYM